MLTRAMSKELSAASAHECLFVDFLSDEEPKKVSEVLKHPGWVDVMQEELNQFSRNKVWTLVPTPYGKSIFGSKWVFRNKGDETDIVIKKQGKALIIEYFVKISKKARILELKRRNLKKTILTFNTPYSSRKIRRICACTSQETMKTYMLYLEYIIHRSSSPEFDLFSDLEEHSEEEVMETMTETIEEYMCKTRGDHGSGVTRPKIEAKDHFELKGQFLNELNVTNTSRAIPNKTAANAKQAIQEMAEYYQKWHNGTSRTRSTETFDGLAAIQAQLNNLGREIKKVNEKIYVAQVGCELSAVPGFYQRNNANPSYQGQRQLMEESLSKFMTESAKRYEENSNVIKKIRASTEAAIKNRGASIKALENQIGQMSKVLQERGSGGLPSSIETNPRDHINSISTIVETDTTQYAVWDLPDTPYRPNRTVS
ncbi:hypothetical protein Tco_0481027 [Tanacetum coccineum]